jgi:N-acyl-D-amino-acid deacylase
MVDILIRNGVVVDGQKTPRFTADVAIQGDKIVAVGSLGELPATTVIDAQGKIVAPGFIDVHTHSDAALLATPHLTGKTTQGFTTEFLMLDGISYAPVNRHTVQSWIQYLRPLNGLPFGGYSGWETVGDYMRLLDGHTAQNVATFIPYANVRTLACGWGERHPNDYQIMDMQALIAQGMGDGACGLSTGLDYVDESYAGTAELTAVSLGMAPKQGVYVTHVRYARGTLEGLREAVEIGKRAGVPVHISHLKGTSEEETEDLMDYIDLVAINEVDFSFDVYPYMSSSTMLQYLLPMEIWSEGVFPAFAKLADPALRDRFQRRLNQMDLNQILIAWLPGRRNNLFLGWSLQEYVEETKRRAADALCDLLIEESMAVLLVFRREENGLESAFIEHDSYMMGSDGIYFPDGITHPRQNGSASRLLGQYVRKKRILTLEDAIWKLSGFAAKRFKLAGRGAVRPNHFADIVIFDADTIADRASFDHPNRLSVGVEWVLVNGVPIIAGGQVQADTTPGRYLRYGA